MLRLRSAVALVGDPHVELTSSQRLAFAVLAAAFSDTSHVRLTVLLKELDPWVALAGLEAGYVARRVETPGSRRRFAQQIGELLELSDTALPLPARRKE